MPPGMVHRYTMTKEEILECAKFAHSSGYGSLVLQSGWELPTPARQEFICDITCAIRDTTTSVGRSNHLSPQVDESSSVLGEGEDERGLCVVLSVGEASREVYQRFFDAGATRYLLRAETSDPDLYSQIHPQPSHSFETRQRCLQDLKDVGFQVGTGVMIGLPGQTVDHLARDLIFLKEFGTDMVGAGPYLPHKDTPIGEHWLLERAGCSSAMEKDEKDQLLRLTTRFYALARMTLGDVNIAATTALQGLHPAGREIALRRGCNVIMPILTPQRLRENYKIYEGKPCIDEDAIKCFNCIKHRVQMAGKSPLMDGGWHDPPHYKSRRMAERAVTENTSQV
ncbi:unnamed protein product [Discosporangium mesarthrocarpum]